MRKYGKWLLVLGVLAANPVVASADGFLGGRLKPQMPFSGSSEKARNQAKADEVASAMKSADVRGTDIEIEFKDGVAILHGKVHEASQRALAQSAAASVPGVQQVENNIRFVPPGGGQIERASATRSADPRQDRVVQAAAFETAETRTRAIQRVNAEVPTRDGVDNQAVAQQIADSLSNVGLVGYEMTLLVTRAEATMTPQLVSEMRSRLPMSAAGLRPVGVEG